MIYIYIGRFFCNFLFKLTGTGRVWVRAGFLPKLGPVSGFFFFLNLNPTLFLIGPGNGSGRAKYPRDGLKLPSLLDSKI